MYELSEDVDKDGLWNPSRRIIFIPHIKSQLLFVEFVFVLIMSYIFHTL